MALNTAVVKLLQGLAKLVGWIGVAIGFYYISVHAYHIRTYAIRNYGPVIHEFDPWFNFRATKYLAEEGWTAFFTWFDHTSWYPLGRPVATTIYPGMQILSVAIWQGLSKVMKNPMSLNDVCVYVPCWFGAVASLSTAMLAYETTFCSGAAAVVAGGVMAIVPAHLSRSVGGGYDNESVAMSFMCLTFWLWCRSLRVGSTEAKGGIIPAMLSTLTAIGAGLAYTGMAASWGGYVFVINMVGLHAGALLVLHMFAPFSKYIQYHFWTFYRCYTTFFIVGTTGAVHVPVISWTPLRSVEQLMPLLVFGVLQVMAVRKLYVGKTGKTTIPSSVKTILSPPFLIASAVAVVSILMASGQATVIFAPWSKRVAALFGKHATRTGNPLVDSVAEHQPGRPEAYWQYLERAQYTALAGFAILVLKLLHTLATMAMAEFPLPPKKPSPSQKSAKPAGSQNLKKKGKKEPEKSTKSEPPSSALAEASTDIQTRTKAAHSLAMHANGTLFLVLYGLAAYFFSLRMSRLILLMAIPASALSGAAFGFAFDWVMLPFLHPEKCWVTHKEDGMPFDWTVRWTLALVQVSLLCGLVYSYQGEFKGFYETCHNMAQWSLSHPQIMSKNSDGSIMDDYRQSYFWLRDKTKPDARVLSWWDYGYQIAGLAERTTLADGNTWNQEHIGLVGLMLTSPLHSGQAHKLARHLADYILVWAKSDIGKSSHMARISNSIYPGHCSEYRCLDWGHGADGQPTKMMKESFMYYACNQPAEFYHENAKAVGFKEVFVSRQEHVRIFKVLKVSKASKKWAANHTNRLCDRPGSWYCPGQYPPGLRQLFAEVEPQLLNDTKMQGDKEYKQGLKLAKGHKHDGLRHLPEGGDALSLEAQKYRMEHAKRLGAQYYSLPRENGPGIPDGSYLGSCRGCSMNGMTLRCTHCEGRASWSDTQLDIGRCERGMDHLVDNMGGTLRCKALPNAANIPSGGYRGSCLGCKMINYKGESAVMCTHCNTAWGEARETVMPLSRCPKPGHIDNRDGLLYCGGLGNARGIPEGGYANSCQGCRMTDGNSVLRCSHCLTADGHQIVTKLSLRDCGPGQRPDNNNGRLVCK